ncbi:MAG: NAD(P)-binding domain-containing protein [Azospirillaceae bacterium]
MVIGFVGVGRLARFMITGLRRNGDAPDIVLSPRNEQLSRTLSGLDRVERARSNQAVVDGADVVIISVPPMVATEVMSALRFTSGQTVISCVAGATAAEVISYVKPANGVCAMPMGAADSLGFGVTPLFPVSPIASTVLGRLGRVRDCHSQQEFGVLATLGGVSGALFLVSEAIIGWYVKKGCSEALAMSLFGQVLDSASAVITAHNTCGMRSIIDGVAPRNGLTRMAESMLEHEDAASLWSRILDSMHQRLTVGEPDVQTIYNDATNHR